MGTENNQTEILNDYNNKHLINLNSKTINRENEILSMQQNCNTKDTTYNEDDNVPNLSITIDENNVIDGAKQILKVIRNSWNLHDVKFKFFTDGITNKLVGCFYNKSQLPISSTISLSPSSSSLETADQTNNSTQSILTKNVDNNTDVVLIRVYGNNTELLIDRKAEQQNIRLLHTYGFAPSLFATFKNGLAYEYVPGSTLTSQSITQPKIWTLIAQRMAEMHKVKSPMIVNDTTSVNFKPMLWNKTQTLFSLIPEKFSDNSKQERVSKVFSSITSLREEFEELYAILEKLKSPLVFAHNDLLLGNVIYNEKLNRITFIDYEYAAVNFQGFDIGNHFAEFTGIEIDEIDYSRYPSKEFQMKWLNVYLKSYLLLEDDDDVPNNLIERLYIQANKFALASHLFWAIWGLVQAENSTIDFDFIKYSQLRYEEYLARKNQFLNLKM